MYILLLLILLAAGGALAWAGRTRRRPVLVWAGAGLATATVALFAVMGLWGEALWFHGLGYGRRFWVFLTAQALTAAAGAGAALAAYAMLILPVRGLRPWAFDAGAAVAALGGLMWGLDAWREALLFLNQLPAGVREPVLGLDGAFYLFTLPLLDSLHGLLVWVLAVAAGATVVAALVDDQRLPRDVAADPLVGRAILRLSTALGVTVAVYAVLKIPHLLYSEWGVVTGPGWTDVHVRLPGFAVLAAVSLLLGLAPLLPAVRTLASRYLGPWLPYPFPAAAAAGAAWAATAAAWLLVAGLLPSAFQWLEVEPNEISYERPYIANNIALTRHGFALDRVEQRQYGMTESFTRATVSENRHLLSEIRLWDWRALDAVYRQFQEIRLYYEFVDVDMDRYTLGDRYRQVMVSAREMSQDNLPAQSQTFVNRRFKYTHGYGLTLSTVSDFTPQGLPNMLVKDIPPEASHPRLEVERPEIYYGQLTYDPVVVNTEEKEFDHPRGEKNVYVRYQGDGGVPMRNLWRKFVFGWKLDGTRLLLSGYPRPESRFMIHRQIEERVETIAPFLALDHDPYMVIHEGRLKWIMDAYTRSTYFPYSTPFDATTADQGLRPEPGVDDSTAIGYLDGANYARNAVKVVVDAYDGSVDLYVFEPDDPIVRTWRRILPGLFKDRAEMPDGLEAHVRYPQGMLLTQGLVFARYHMDDPEVFYNQEDLWVRATEKHYGRVQPVEPYYVMWEFPGADEAEFVLMLPFTPKNRQVLIGWIAGLSDGDNYGRFLAYQFPKERRILGPQQVETKIDQDSYLSGQLTLWDQRGSNVIRGNVLAIPLDNTLLYVEPIYLQAETAAYPELRLVVLMHGDNMSYAESFDKALEGLLEKDGARPPLDAGPAGYQEALSQAGTAFEAYLEAQGEGRFEDAAAALRRLESLLSRDPGGARSLGPAAP